MSRVTFARAELTVVKLGGSYAFSPHLRAALKSICAAEAPVVLVPGGGPFADAVREAQPRMGFNDGAAHKMALLAMAQFAQALVSLGSVANGERRESHAAARAVNAVKAPSPGRLMASALSREGRGPVSTEDRALAFNESGVALSPRGRGRRGAAELGEGAFLQSSLMGEDEILCCHRSHSRLHVAATCASIREALAERAVPVWSPWPIADGLEALPESWQLTSDSLAAWLAGKLGAGRLLLLKHRDPPRAAISLANAAQAGIVDALFPNYARESRAAVRWLGPSHLGALTQILDGSASAGLALTSRPGQFSPA